MAATPTQLVRAAATTGTSTLFTNTSGTTTIVSTLMIANNSSSAQTFTLMFGGVAMFTSVSIPANTTFQLEDVRQVLTGTQTIAGSASATTVAFHISGTSITA